MTYNFVSKLYMILKKFANFWQILTMGTESFSQDNVFLGRLSRKEIDKSIEDLLSGLGEGPGAGEMPINPNKRDL